MDWRLVWEQRKREVIVLVVLFLVLIVLFYAGSNLTLGRQVCARFEENQVRPGQQTLFIVEVTNTLDRDAENVSVTVKPEHPLTVKPESVVEPVIASGSSRQFDFGVKVNTTANPGKYRLDVTVDMGEPEPWKTTTFLEVVRYS
jgi:hypothetical protein